MVKEMQARAGIGGGDTNGRGLLLWTVTPSPCGTPTQATTPPVVVPPRIMYPPTVMANNDPAGGRMEDVRDKPVELKKRG